MSQMKQYHDLIENILLNGKDILNTRTGSICKTIIGCQMTFDMSEGFPALTTRKLPFKSIRGELLGFFRGYTSAADFRALGCKFWDGNANETKAWLDNFYRKGQDDCGNIYGKQWTNWEVIRISESEEESKYLSKEGSEWEFLGSTDYNHPNGSGLDIYRKYINQLENVVRTIITNPSDRRLIVSGWNIGEFDRMSLPPCHVQYNFIPLEQDKTISVVMTIRSMDGFLGTPANIASTAIFLAVVGRLTGYTPDKVIIQDANAHLYENSFEVAKELLTREHYPAPKLVLSDNIKEIKNLEDIKGCFSRIEPEDITLENYSSHSVLTVPMIA